MTLKRTFLEVERGFFAQCFFFTYGCLEWQQVISSSTSTIAITRIVLLSVESSGHRRLCNMQPIYHSYNTSQHRVVRL